MSIVIFIFILAVLIIVHEYGHFIVAKLFGIRVDEFGLGYPPRALSLWKRKGTLFTLNWIPFGGFVKIFGEQPDEAGSAHAPDSLMAKPKRAQALVMFAGPLFNFLFAWLVIFVTLLVGTPSSVNEKTTEYVSDVRTVIVEVVDASPADVAGIEPGDALRGISFDGRTFVPVHTVTISEEIKEEKATSVLLEITRDGVSEIKEVVVDPTSETPMLGIGFQDVGLYKPPFLKALTESFVHTGAMIWEITKGLGILVFDAVRGQADVSNLTGPVGIVSLVGDASSLGFVYLLTFVALISINLGVINLIPFPALDGGRILFLFIEKMKGSAISPRVANTVNTIGFLLLIGLMVFITFRDIMRLL